MKRTLLYLSAILLVAAAATGCSGAASSSQAAASPAPAVAQSEASSQSTDKVELGRVIRPLPLSVDIANLGDCTVGAAVAPDGIFLDDSGKAQMTLTLYEYDLYDMVDVSVLAPGDVIELNGEDVLLESVERTDSGLVVLNGGLEQGGYDLATDDETVYYLAGFDDYKSWRALGTVTLPVSEEFTYLDASDFEKEPQTWYVGDFLQPEAQLPDDLTPNNTTVTIQNGEVVGLVRSYVP